MRLIFNILAVCGAAVFTGVMLNIGLTLGAYWRSLPPAEFLEWFSRNGHFVGRTIPLYLAPTILGMAGSFWLEWSDSHQRHLWGTALICILALLVITAIYHLPMNSQFAAKAVSPDQVPAALTMWLRLHAVRVALGLIASVIGLVAVSR